MKLLSVSFIAGAVMCLSNVVSANGHYDSGVDTIVRINTWEEKADVFLKEQKHNCPKFSEYSNIFRLPFKENGGTDKMYSSLLSALMSGSKINLRYRCDDEGVMITGVRQFAS